MPDLHVEATGTPAPIYRCRGCGCVCRLIRSATAEPYADYTHYAFSLNARDFVLFVQTLKAVNVQEWRDNGSEGASFYFLDPDGHKLEAHVGNLASRLAACRLKPYAGMRFYDES